MKLPTEQPGPGRTRDETVRTEFFRLLDAGAVDAAFVYLRSRTAQRADPAATTTAPEPVTRRAGDGRTAFLAIPSLPAPASPRQYDRLAEHMPEGRAVHALPLPGYRGGLLPGSLEALAVLLAAAADSVVCENLVLVGHSSASWVVHTLAERLAVSGRPAAGVVLLDPGLPEQFSPAELPRVSGRLWPDRATAGLTEAALTAMVRYFDMYNGWHPRPGPTPVLVIRPAHRIAGHVAGWTGAADERRVPGDHLSILGDYAPQTAQTIREWIGSRDL